MLRAGEKGLQRVSEPGKCADAVIAVAARVELRQRRARARVLLVEAERGLDARVEGHRVARCSPPRADAASIGVRVCEREV